MSNVSINESYGGFFMRNHRFHYRMSATICILIMLITLFSGFFIGLNTFSTNARADPPADYNHRPMDEFFTSLACPPCVHNADPAQDEVWEDWGYDPAVRYNWVVFHTDIPDSDDLSTTEGRQRQNDYNYGPTVSNPTVIYDGGYIEGNGYPPEESKGYINDSGRRDVIRDVEVYIEQEFTTDGIIFHYQVHYLGGEGLYPDTTPTVDDLDASIYIFVVEDNVNSRNLVDGGYYLCHNVFREYALEDEQQRLVEGEWYNNSVTWQWPSPEPMVPIQPHMVIGIIGVFDTEDTSSGEPAITMPRVSNSANYISTIWDWEEDVPTISNVQITDRVSDSLISADISDSDGISSAWLIYNITDSAYNWSIIEMDVDAQGYASIVFIEEEDSIMNYTILAFDNNYLGSQTPLELHTIVFSDDTTPPAQINNLLATPGSAEGEVELTWTAPGDDGDTGTATKYYIRYNTTQITSSNWDVANEIPNVPAPKSGGSPESITLEELTPGETFYFAIRAEDEVGNIAPISNSPGVEVPSDPGDITPPSKIDDLGAEAGDNVGEIILTWTAPGDDGSIGTASKYYIRYSGSEIISETDWDSATVVSNALLPKSAGEQESFTTEGLTPFEIFYFAVRAEDDVQLLSSISNSPSVTVPGGDTTAPAKITDLIAIPGENVGEVELTWTAPGDDGNSGGKASKYIIRYSLTNINGESDWDSADDIIGEPNPGDPGNTENIIVSFLTPDTGHYFAIKTEDEVPNLSDLSNTAYAIATGTQLEPPEISNIYLDKTDPTPSDEINIYATVTGDVKTVELSICKLNDTCSIWNMEDVGNNLYKASVGQLEEGDYEYKIIVKDSQNEKYESEYYYFTVAKSSTDNGDVIDDIEEPPWYESENARYMIILLIVVIIVCAILAGLFARPKKKAKEIATAQVIPEPAAMPLQEPMAEPVFTPYTMPQYEEISCPKCNTVFNIPTDVRPMEVQCPSCGTRGIID